MKFAATIALVLAVAFAPLAHAQPVDNRAAVMAASDAFDNAQRTQDRAALERVIAPDYQLVHGSGRVGGREDFISGMVGPDNHITAVEAVNRTYIPLGRDAGIVSGQGTITGTDSTGAFSEHFQFADTFVHRDGQWVVVYTQVTMLPAPAAH
ncbi:MAG: nuclear transport factor 2 family protein [Terricaulis sp.]